MRHVLLKCLHQADFASFCDFGIGFSSCSNSVVFVCVSFYRNKNMFKCKNVIVNILVCPQSLSFCPVDLQYIQCLCSLGRGKRGRGGSWSSKWKLNHDWVNRYRIVVLWFTTDMFCLLSESRYRSSLLFHDVSSKF